MVCAVVAMAHNRVIGSKNDLPWYLPADLKHFRELTVGTSVVMGRRTYDSIVVRLGKPLPKRQNIVITRTPQAKDGVVEVTSIDEAIKVAKSDTICIIGGAQIYQLALPKVERMYVTEVDADIAGDTYFPEFKASEWREVSRESHKADDSNQYNYDFVVLDRI